jgi:4-hydroxyphenylacetate 3-monooxygenase
MRAGKDYLAALDDGRAVYLDGEVVRSVAEHKAFRGITRSVASLYDAARAPAAGMTHLSPATGAEANCAFMIPAARRI